MQIKILFRRVLYSGVVGTELTNTNVSIFITSDAGNTWREVQSNKWFQNDWNWPLFVFTKTHARKEHNFTPATSDWRWGERHWELHTAASFHLFTYLFFYIFVSQTSKKKKKRFDTRACARHVEPFSARQTSPKIPAVTTRLQRAAQCNFPQHRLPFWKALNDRLFNTVYLALCVEPPVKASFLSFCQNRRTRLCHCRCVDGRIKATQTFWVTSDGWRGAAWPQTWETNQWGF